MQSDQYDKRQNGIKQSDLIKENTLSVHETIGVAT